MWRRCVSVTHLLSSRDVATDAPPVGMRNCAVLSGDSGVNLGKNSCKFDGAVN